MEKAKERRKVWFMSDLHFSLVSVLYFHPSRRESDGIILEGKKDGRKECQCPSNKYELIKDKPHRCEHKCLYCFWKN